MSRSLRTHNPDYVFIIAVAFLTVFGLVVLASASSEIGRIRFGDSFFYLKRQMLNGVLVGVFGFIAAYLTPLKTVRKASLYLLLLTIGLLILVFTPLGFTAGGATRWITIAGVTIQPAEILKLTFVLYLAAWFAGDINKKSSFVEGFVPFMIICGLVAGLLVMQPTTSTAIIILAGSLIMYFIHGGKISFMVLAALAGFLALVVLIAMTPYRLERITNFFDPEADPLGSGFQRNQALIALGSGGVAGVGYGNSIAKTNYLPESISDSVFAIIGEEFGFLGSLILISAFLVIILRMLRISNRAPEPFMQLVAIGSASIIAIQAFINIAAISGLMPLTGVPLPFMSYGGTALAVLLTSMGIIANISKYTS